MLPEDRRRAAYAVVGMMVVRHLLRRRWLKKEVLLALIRLAEGNLQRQASYEFQWQFRLVRRVADHQEQVFAAIERGGFDEHAHLMLREFEDHYRTNPLMFRAIATVRPWFSVCLCKLVSY